MIRFWKHKCTITVLLHTQSKNNLFFVSFVWMHYYFLFQDSSGYRKQHVHRQNNSKNQNAPLKLFAKNSLFKLAKSTRFETPEISEHHDLYISSSSNRYNQIYNIFLMFIFGFNYQFCVFYSLNSCFWWFSIQF